MLECIAVWREVDLYDEWMPMCNEAKKLVQIGKSELIAWQKTGVIPLVRDMVVHAFGDVSMDSSADDPCFLICGRSVTQEEYPDVPIPQVGCRDCFLHLHEVVVSFILPYSVVRSCQDGPHRGPKKTIVDRSNRAILDAV